VPDYLSRNRSDAQWARAQGALIDFLNAYPRGCELALAKVRVALKAVRRLAGKVDRALARRAIDARKDELETAISLFDFGSMKIQS
jgi:hypothetical protein